MVGSGRRIPPGVPIYLYSTYIYISVVNGLASLGHGLMGLTPSGDHGGRDLASLARGLMALTPSGDRIQWKESLQGFKGSQVARKGQTWTKRAKKAFLDHIIDQKRLIKGFRLKISKIKFEK